MIRRIYIVAAHKSNKINYLEPKIPKIWVDVQCIIQMFKHQFIKQTTIFVIRLTACVMCIGAFAAMEYH